MSTNGNGLQSQLQKQRRSVDFDTYDIVAQQLITMVEEKAIHVAPKYQRKFRWDPIRCSQLIESLLLGIPVPSLFMATNDDSTWELVDGVQRISSIIRFAGDESIRERMKLGEPLRLEGLQKLDSFDGFTFQELPHSLQLHFNTRPIKVVTLSDKSDLVVRFDLFERLNTGGIALSDQEIRDCIYHGKFADFLERLTKDQNFRQVVKLQKGQEQDGTREECVLRFFAYFHNYRGFEHSVVGFLNDYMASATRDFDYERGESLFKETFLQLAAALPAGIHRPHRKGKTSLILYEGVSVGAALALQKKKTLHTDRITEWMGSDTLTEYTTGATNNFTAVKGRIAFCRDRFLGK